jgi:hypothetical protein
LRNRQARKIFGEKILSARNGSQGTVNAKLPPEGLFLTHTR